ncbi:eukaryotic translation initiation factor 4G-like [Humulus lupulus]|uniref:eukaryotic translation initiation factor 4G-like n=1 Tax=Humulus lupulus TaxID=3486 RepID=UPI002B40C59F|nr:eukaryotic translation initiation factor 4G-like [Humulus lupulus]
MMDKTKNYEMGKAKKEEQTKQRKFEDILNKLTPQNFEELFEQVKDVNIDNAGTLRGVVAQIYDKALMEPTFCEMCANFCFHLSGELPDFSEDNEKITFKRLLINKCQEEFERGEREQEEANKANEEGEEREEKRNKARRRMLGNIRLIGELYKKKMLTERIMHECIKKLLDSQHQTPDEEDVEALCELMSTIGEIIDHPKAKKHMDAYFDSMETLSNHMTLSSRIRFMLKDTIDLRKNKWQQRKRVEGPKEIQEIHYQQAKSTGIRGSAVLFSPSSQLGSQNVHLDAGQPFEAIALSVPLTRRPVCDDASTSVSQGGISRVVSNRGSLSLPFSSLADSPRKDVILRMWLEELQEKSKAAIKEFYSTRDVEEVTQFIKESNFPSFHPTLVLDHRLF